MDYHLVLLDERAHPAKGGLEGREPIRGLLRNVRALFTIFAIFCLFAGSHGAVKESNERQVSDLPTSSRIRVILRSPGARQYSHSMHDFFSEGVRGHDWERGSSFASLGATATRSNITTIMTAGANVQEVEPLARSTLHVNAIAVRLRRLWPRVWLKGRGMVMHVSTP